MVIGGGSYLDQLATLAGARNVFHDLGASDVVSQSGIVRVQQAGADLCHPRAHAVAIGTAVGASAPMTR